MPYCSILNAVYRHFFLSDALLLASVIGIADP
jgi:hypothetical protein